MFSVDTAEEARDLQVFLCRHTYKGDGWVWTDFSGNADNLDTEVTAKLRAAYAKMKARRATKEASHG